MKINSILFNQKLSLLLIVSIIRDDIEYYSEYSMKTLKILLFFLLLWLQYSLWIGKNGCFDYIKIYQKVLIQKKNNSEMDVRNNKIILEIKNLNDRIKYFEKKNIN